MSLILIQIQIIIVTATVLNNKQIQKPIQDEAWYLPYFPAPAHDNYGLECSGPEIKLSALLQDSWSLQTQILLTFHCGNPFLPDKEKPQQLLQNLYPLSKKTFPTLSIRRKLRVINSPSILSHIYPYNWAIFWSVSGQNDDCSKCSFEFEANLKLPRLEHAQKAKF